MSADENKKLVRDAFAAWASGDANAFFNLLADDVRWMVIGSTRISRAFNSKQEFLEGAVRPLTGKLATPIKPEFSTSSRKATSSRCSGTDTRR
jgi:uncharacterized protein (TIGR02246 family)